MDSGNSPLGSVNLYGGATALPGTGLYFPGGTMGGTGGYACMPSLQLGGSDTSFAVWVRYTKSGLTWQRVFDLGIGSSSASCTGVDFSNWVFLSQYGSSPQGVVSTRNNKGEVYAFTNSTSFWTVGAWQHVVVTVPLVLSSLTIYGNGAVAGSGGASPAGVLASQQTFYSAFLGKPQYGSNSDYFVGLIAEFQVYSSLLSASQARLGPVSMRSG